MNIKRIVILVLLPLIFYSCVTTKSINKTATEAMNSWLGNTKHSLIMQLGPPTQTTSDGNSGEILVYATRIYLPGTGYNPTRDFWEYRMYYANSKDIIYHWILKRNPNPPDRIDIRILTN